MLKRILLLIFLFSSLSAFTRSGYITDSQGKPIPEVIVYTSGRVVISNANGYYQFNELSDDDSLRFHKIGYADRIFPAVKVPGYILLERDAIQIQKYNVSEDKTLTDAINGDEKVMIKSSELEKAGDLSQLIASKSELLLKGDNLVGSEKTLSFPGFKAKHTLVMIDGIPLNANGEAFDLTSIPLEIVKSVEISRGAIAQINGLNAMGGVIDIKTKTAESNFKAELGYGFGSFGLERTSFTLSNAKTNYNYLMYVNRSNAQNDFLFKPPAYWPEPDSLRKRINNKKEILDLHLNGGMALPSFNIQYKLLFQDVLKELPGPTNNPQLYENSFLNGTSQRHFLRIFYPRKTYRLKLTADYQSDRTKYNNTSIDSLLFPNYYALTKTVNSATGGKMEVEYGEKDFHFIWGGDARYSDYSHEDKLNDETTGADFTTAGLFANCALRKDLFPYKMDMILSTKYERTSDFGDFTNWSITPGVAYENIFTIRLGASINNAYNLPSFYDLYWKGDNLALGNPDLEPERSLHWQLYSKLTYVENYLKFTYSKDELKDMISWIKNFDHQWKPINLEAAEIQNYKMEAAFKLHDFADLQAKYNINDAVDKSKTESGEPTAFYGKQLIYTPEYELQFILNFAFKDLSVQSSYREYGEQWTTRDQLTADKKIAPYHLVDLSLAYQIELGNFVLKPALYANNIFDKHYEIYAYNPRPGFNWEIKLKLEYQKHDS